MYYTAAEKGSTVLWCTYPTRTSKKPVLTEDRSGNPAQDENGTFGG